LNKVHLVRIRSGAFIFQSEHDTVQDGRWRNLHVEGKANLHNFARNLKVNKQVSRSSLNEVNLPVVVVIRGHKTSRMGSLAETGRTL
jgi:hypothetical protein